MSRTLNSEQHLKEKYFNEFVTEKKYFQKNLILFFIENETNEAEQWFE